MTLNKKKIIILLIFVVALLVIGVACAQADNAAKVKQKKVTVNLYNFKPGALWAPNAIKLKNSDAIAGYIEYNGNMQFDKGTGVTCWYLGNGNNGDITPHYTKLVKAKFYFKDKKGKIKTKTVTGNGGHIRTNLINGYTPYKADVWYTTTKWCYLKDLQPHITYNNII